MVGQQEHIGSKLPVFLHHLPFRISTDVAGEKKIFPVARQSDGETFVVFVGNRAAQMEVRDIDDAGMAVVDQRFALAGGVNGDVQPVGESKQPLVVLIWPLVPVDPDTFGPEAADDESKPVAMVGIRMADNQRIQPADPSVPEKRGNDPFPHIELRRIGPPAINQGGIAAGKLNDRRISLTHVQNGDDIRWPLLLPPGRD